MLYGERNKFISFPKVSLLADRVGVWNWLIASIFMLIKITWSTPYCNDNYKFLWNFLHCLLHVDCFSCYRCSLKLPQLQKHLLAWYEYMETKKELDYMLKQQRQQLDTIRHQIEVDFPKNKPSIQNDLKVSRLFLFFFFLYFLSFQYY